jgi:hypothetical protein
MIPLALALCVATTGVTEGGAGKSVLVLELSHKEADAEAAKLLNRVIADELEDLGRFEVMTTADLKRQVELESEREILGCNTDESSCLSELADALGADFVVGGDIGKLGAQYVVTISAFDSVRARSFGREVIQADKLEEMPARIRLAIRQVFPADKLDEIAPLAARPSIAPTLLIAGATTAAAAAALAVGLDVALGAQRVPVNKDAIAITEIGAWGLAAAGAVVAVVGGVMLVAE